MEGDDDMQEFKTENYEYLIFTDNQNIDSMKIVADEFINHGYSKLLEYVNGKDTVLIYVRKIGG